MATLRVPKYINFTNTTAETYPVNVEDFSCNSYIVTTNTVSQLTGDKAITFTGTPDDNVELVFDLQGGFDTSGASKLKINGTDIPDLVASVLSRVVFTYINTQWIMSIFISDTCVGYITTGMIADGAVTKEKINSDVAGSGLEKPTTADPISIKLEGSDPTLKIVGGELGAKLDPTGAIESGASGMKVKLEATNPSLQVVGNELGVKIDPSGGLASGATGVGLKNAPCVCVKEVTISIPAVDVLQLYTVPQVALSVPNGYICQFVGVPVIKVVLNGTPYTTNTNVRVRGALSADVFWECDCLASIYTGYYLFRPAPQSSMIIPEIGSGNDIYITVDGGDPLVGDGDIQITFMYRLLPY